MNAVLYADFTCPACYLASRRVELLEGTADDVEWRAVERDPHLPVSGLRLDAAAHRDLGMQWEATVALLLPSEELPGTVPTFVPNTRAAVAGYAEACGAGVGSQVRHLLFEAYWVGGADIGNPEVLRVLLATTLRGGSSTSHPIHDAGFAVSFDRGPVTTAAYQRIRDWRQAWQHLPSPALPTLIDGDRTYTGETGLGALADAVGDRRPRPAAAPAVPLQSSRFWY